MTDHESIWLEPKCGEYVPEGRLWCQDRLDDCDDCGEKAVQFIRADIVDALRSERDRLREALTPSAATKAAYMGEFSIRFPESDADGEEYIRSINIPWTTIKEIMAAILARTALSPACPEAQPASTSRSTSAGKGASE